MIKSLNKNLLTLTIITQVFLLSGLTSNRKILALSQEEVLQKLAPITLFTIGNQKGDLIFIQTPNKPDVALLYISQQQAQRAAQQLNQTKPGNSYQVIPVSLADMYKFFKEKSGQPNAPVLQLVPVQQEVEAAKGILSQQNQVVKDFPGVPLFYITYEQDKKEVFLTAKNGTENIIPLSFEKDFVQNQIQIAKQQQPDLAGTFKIRVMTLQSLILLFEQKDNDGIRKMVVIPSQETIEFSRQLQQQQKSP
ncbi:Tic22 family protein [Gloeothece verrucosa]|uniref:Tic22 family protein n=1 Tax=Gloeothece verrucosa (strain PCC 7822) TaxID=497965 RepID=E0U6N7_GLOV7|nr:Tic22 family protein [Gloeothece verrucosa]ADN14796.1 Tic22 family protein [Gloeothece verrucosa PCC 7822]